MRTTTLVTLLALGVSHALVSSAALADVPVCGGSDPALARRQVEDGMRHYRHALSLSSLDADEMRAALSEFDAACAAGDSMVLEPRAYALFALKRNADAAESLDAFLAAHPLDALPKNIHDRVVSQQTAILATVGTLRVTSPTPNAKVIVAGRAPVSAPVAVRLMPATPVDVTVSAPGLPPVTRSVTVEAQATREESFDLKPGALLTIDAPAGAEVRVDGAAVGRTPLPPMHYDPGSVSVSVAIEGHDPIVRRVTLAAGEEHTETFAAAAGAGSAPGSLRTWVYVSGGASAAMLGAGIGFAVWRSNRTSTYDASCLVANEPTGCSATLSQFHAAEIGEIVTFALSGALAATAVTLFVVDRPHASAPAQSSLRCAPGAASSGGGLLCSGTF